MSTLRYKLEEYYTIQQYSIEKQYLRIPLTFLLIFVFLFCSACGYKPTHLVSSIFPSSDVRLSIRNIVNPTLSTQLPYHLRSALYNGITNRKIATWMMDPPSDYEMEVKVLSYRVEPRTVIEDDVVLLYVARINIEVTIYDYHTGELFWRSGNIVTEQTYNTFSDEIVLPQLLSLATNDIIDAMQVQF